MRFAIPLNVKAKCKYSWPAYRGKNQRASHPSAAAVEYKCVEKQYRIESLVLFGKGSITRHDQMR